MRQKPIVVHHFHHQAGLSWTTDADACEIIIKSGEVVVMRLSVTEALEQCSGKKIKAHVAECDKTPYLSNWHGSKP